jgi:predicted O-methyltransferase YrrM
VEYPNWFELTAKDNFEFVLKDYAGKPDLRFLQLGAFTGDASVWLAENILTGSNCWLIDVDTWEGSKENLHETMDFEDVFTVYKNKTAPYNDRIISFRSTTTFHLQSVRRDPGYDFIYVDADHTAAGVLNDAVMAWQHLKSGGIMAFDDYTWFADSGLEVDTPKPAINFFYWANQKQIEPVLVNGQFWIKKI